jgi:hypothetical protein
MSVEMPASGPQAPGQPAGNGSPANEPSISIEDLTAKVAEQLLPRLSQEITGASKRHSASLKEEIQAMLKGNADAPKPGDDKSKDKADPRDVELTRLRKDVERLTKEQDASIRDARDGVIAKALADYEAITGKKVTNPGREFGVLALEKALQRMEDRSWVVKNGDDTQTLADYVSKFYGDRPELLASSARAGTGAQGSKGAQVQSSDMPKTRQEVLFVYAKDPVTGAMVRKGNRPYADVKAFQKQFPEIWANMPER